MTRKSRQLQIGRHPLTAADIEAGLTEGRPMTIADLIENPDPTYDPLSPNQLKAWMKRHNLSKAEVFRITGIDTRTLDQYLDGSRPIPKVLHLACMAFDNGICPWGY